MVVGFELFSKFLRFVHSGVYGPPKVLSGLFQYAGKVEPRCGSDDNQVDVACALLLPAGHRAVDEGEVYSVLKGRKKLTENIDEPDSL